MNNENRGTGALLLASSRRKWLGVLVAVAVLASSCRGGSSDAGGSGGFQASEVPVLDAVAYHRPGLALDTASDPVLKSHGDLLFGERDLSGGYVLDDRWCDSGSARCVTVSGNDSVMFGDEPLESFVLKPDYRVSDPDVKVVQLRALHHPVSNEVRMALELESDKRTWATPYDRVQVTTPTETEEAILNGPDTVQPGVVTHHEIGPIDVEISGRTEFLVTLGQGFEGGDEVKIAIRFDDETPEIERSDASLEERPSPAIYRSPESLDDSEEGSDNGSEAIAALIAAIVDGEETTSLVEPDTPAALAVEVFQNGGDMMTPRRDPENANALCWQTRVRGTFCERWHAGVTDGDVLTSWEVEGVPIDDLVLTREGSLLGGAATLVRSPLSGVVLARSVITNNTTNSFYLSLHQPQVQRDDELRLALAGDGAFELQAGKTETPTALIEAADFDFDLVYPYGSPAEPEYLRFDADAAAASTESNDSSSPDLEAASVSLASQLQRQRFDDAVAATAPDSLAEAYLTAAEQAFSEEFVWLDDGDDPPGSTKVCARDNSSTTCSEVAVTEIDSEGRISDFTIDGTDIANLIVTDKTTQRDQFAATIEQAFVWPELGLFVNWTATNDADGDVRISEMNVVGTDGVSTEPHLAIFDDLPAGRTIRGTTTFDVDSLEGAIEIKGTGLGTVRSFTLGVPLAGSADSIESDVQLEADETELVTPGDTTLTIPGDWSEGYWYDEETGKTAGDGTSLRRVKPIHRGDMSILAFTPEFSPAELSTDQLVAEINTLAPLSEVTTEAMRNPATGEPTTVLEGTTEFFPEPRPVLIFPGETDLILLVWEDAIPENAVEFGATATSIADQLGLYGSE